MCVCVCVCVTVSRVRQLAAGRAEVEPHLSGRQLDVPLLVV